VDRTERQALRAWSETLPFPLAATLALYISEGDDKARVEAALQFFEGAAEFHASVLLGALMQDPTSFNEERARVGSRTKTIKRTTFGFWTEFNRDLAALCGSRAPTNTIPAYGRVAKLCEHRLLECLTEAKNFRNAYTGHQGVPSPREYARRSDELRALLGEYRAALDVAFDGWALVRGRNVEVHYGGFVNNVFELTGSPRAFDQATYELDTPLATNSLYLIEGHERRPLRISPFVRVLQDDLRNEQCWFYSAVDDQGPKWLLRSVGGATDSAAWRGDDELEDVLHQLTGAAVPPFARFDEPTPHPESRDSVVTGDGAPVPPAPRAGPGRDKPLRGRALALRLYDLLQEIDPDHKGVHVAAAYRALIQRGVKIGGHADTTVVNNAIKMSWELFERVGRGTYAWRERTPGSTGLSGSELIPATLDVIRRLDPARRGVSPSTVAKSLTQAGVAVLGPNQEITVWRALGSSPQFVPLDGDTFAFASASGSDQDDVSSSFVADRRPLRNPKGEFAEPLDRRLLSVDPSIGRTGIGDRLIYLWHALPICEVRATRAEVVAYLPIRYTPHLRGCVIEEIRPAAMRDGGYTRLKIGSGRDVEGASLLAATGVLSLSDPELRHYNTRQAIESHVARSSSHVEPPFLPGFGFAWDWGPTQPDRRWTRYWSTLIDHHASQLPMLVGRMTARHHIGTSGQDGTYHSIRFDEYGALVAYWIGDPESRRPEGWRDRFLQSRLQVEQSFGQPLVWSLHGNGVWLAVRAIFGSIEDGDDWPRQHQAIATAMSELVASIRPLVKQLPGVRVY
jgi:hypothetical protein